MDDIAGKDSEVGALRVCLLPRGAAGDHPPDESFVLRIGLGRFPLRHHRRPGSTCRRMVAVGFGGAGVHVRNDVR